MPEGVAEPVVEQPVVQEPAKEPVVEAVVEPVVETKPEPHALEPGGKRFNEVYARAKTAEARMQEEREGRIRAETEASVLRETRSATPTPTEPKELSWGELKAMVADNKITEVDALDYREKLIEKRAAAKAEAAITSRLTSQTRLDRVASEIERYKDAIPDVNKLGTSERAKFDTEFRYQVDVIGLNPKDTATQLTALRAVYGAPDKAVQYAKAKGKSVGAETYAETSGGGSNVNAQVTKSWKDKLQPHEVTHYNRMIERGRYGDPATAWDRVKDEIDFFNKKKGIKA